MHTERRMFSFTAIHHHEPTGRPYLPHVERSRTGHRLGVGMAVLAWLHRDVQYDTTTLAERRGRAIVGACTNTHVGSETDGKDRYHRFAVSASTPFKPGVRSRARSICIVDSQKHRTGQIGNIDARRMIVYSRTSLIRETTGWGGAFVDRWNHHWRMWDVHEETEQMS